MASRSTMNDEKNRILSRLRAALSAALILSIATGGLSFAATAPRQSFTSPEEALKAFVTAARNDDNNELIAIFGPGAKELIFSGDPVADKQRRAYLLEAYDQRSRLDHRGNKIVITIGKEDWQFPIPLVKKGAIWVFDTNAGRQEILNRRIGENELNAIQVCRAIVDAQREYAMKNPMNDELRQYAQKFASDPGKKNGLYWETKNGEEQSPLGPMIAEAKQEGYKRNTGGTPPSYHGYHYKILKAQAKSARGGAYSYLVKGKMIGGFAVVAYPAQYGNSGVMTFIVNHESKVYEKNLGKNTASLAAAMTQFNPDSTWTEVKE